jgi:hypothetical protein
VGKSEVTFNTNYKFSLPIFVTKFQNLILEITTDAPPNSLMDSNVYPKGENNGRIRSWGILPGLQHFGGKGAC